MRTLENWTDQAVCTTLPTEYFYPEDDNYQTSEVRMAKKICRACPVAEICLREALDLNDVNYGVRGATVPRTRKILRAEINKLIA